jgi:hypothetical protein
LSDRFGWSISITPQRSCNKIFSTVSTIYPTWLEDNSDYPLTCERIYRIVTTLEKLLLTAAFVWSRIDLALPDATRRDPTRPDVT